jgi:nucleotide-binding universal stress UspA family protein
MEKALYERILVPVDGSDTAHHGLREAIELASRLRARLHLLHVIDTTPLCMGFAPAAGLNHTLELMKHEGERLVVAGCREAADSGVQADFAVVDIGSTRVADHILSEAERYRADLIVMGTHGRRGFSRFTLGSDAESVARASPVPLLFVRAPKGSRARG